MNRSLRLLPLLALCLVASAAQADTWTRIPPVTTRPLYAIAHRDDSTWVAVGGGGLILRSANGGLTWSPVPGPVADDLRGVAFSGNVGLAVGIAGRVLRTTDGGLHWVTQARPTTKALYAAAMKDSFALVTGEEGGIFASHDFGQTWKSMTAGTASILFGAALNGPSGVAVGGQGAIAMCSNIETGWGLVNEGGQLTFFYATSFINASTGWAVGASSTGGSIVLRSDLGGVTWALQPVPSTVQLFGVSFAAPDTGTAVGELGTIIHTDDGGSHWALQPGATPQHLWAVAFAHARFGIAVGDSGAIERIVPDPVTAVAPGAPGRLALRVLGNAVATGDVRLALELPQATAARVEVLDVTGRRVAVLAEGAFAAGTHELRWDRRVDAGARAAAGVYFVRAGSGAGEAGAKVLVLR